MVRKFQVKDDWLNGKLAIEPHKSSGQVEVFYIPSPILLAEHDIYPDNAEDYKKKLIEFSTKSGKFSIYPINTTSQGDKFLKPKYNKIRKITLADGTPVLSESGDETDLEGGYVRSVTFGKTEPIQHKIDEQAISSSPNSDEQIINILESLPPAFTKDYDYGLGLANRYRFIVEAIEELTNCTEIEISKHCETEVDEVKGLFHINSSDFEIVRKMLNATTHLGQVAGRTVKQTETYNFFAEILGQKTITLNMGRHRLRKLFTAAIHNDKLILSDAEQEEIVNTVIRNVKSISESKPERLIRLQNDLELANLESFIDRFRSMINSNLVESKWQKFFHTNPLVLSLAFGYPIIKIGQQASVGGRKIFGGGEKITDFLMKNKVTNNAAIVEIKTPRAKLVQREVRSGVFSPSREISEGIVQALDQRFQFQSEIFMIKGKSGIYDLETYSVQCYLVIGTIPTEKEEQKSFELFRGNSKDVQIITFDELLENLTQLKELLALSEKDSNELGERKVLF